MSDRDGKVPSISIDEALRLFLAITNPGGLPEGMDEQQLVDALKHKVAGDRPDWAQATGELPSAATAASAGLPGAGQATAPKDEDEAAAGAPGRAPGQAAAPQPHPRARPGAVTAAHDQDGDLPEDPEERYFVERRRETEASIRQRKDEEQQTERREHLCRERLARRQADAVVIEGNLQVAAPMRPAHDRASSALPVSSPAGAATSRLAGPSPGTPAVSAPALATVPVGDTSGARTRLSVTHTPRAGALRPRLPSTWTPQRPRATRGMPIEPAARGPRQGASRRGLELTAHTPSPRAGLSVDMALDTGATPGKKRRGLDVT